VGEKKKVGLGGCGGIKERKKRKIQNPCFDIGG
jgi:hypothetical protein